MGIVGNQPVRTRHQFREASLEDDLEFMCEIADRWEVSLSDLIAQRSVKAQEVRNQFMQEDGDYRDEHADGLCNALERIAVAMGEKQ